MLYNYEISDIHTSKEQLQKSKQNLQNSLNALTEFYNVSAKCAQDYAQHLQKWDGKKVTARLASSFNLTDAFTSEDLSVEFTNAKESWKGYPYIAIVCRSHEYVLFDVVTDDNNLLDATATIANLSAEIDKQAKTIEARKKLLGNYEFMHQQYLQALQTVAVIETQIRECDFAFASTTDIMGIQLGN